MINFQKQTRHYYVAAFDEEDDTVTPMLSVYDNPKTIKCPLAWGFVPNWFAEKRLAELATEHRLVSRISEKLLDAAKRGERARGSKILACDACGVAWLARPSAWDAALMIGQLYATWLPELVWAARHPEIPKKHPAAANKATRG